MHDLPSLSKWIVEQGLGEIIKKTKFIKCYKGLEFMASHDHQYPKKAILEKHQLHNFLSL